MGQEGLSVDSYDLKEFLSSQGKKKSKGPVRTVDGSSTLPVKNKSQLMIRKSLYKTKTTWIMAILFLLVLVVGFLALKTRDKQESSVEPNRPLQSVKVVEPPPPEPSSEKKGSSSQVETRKINQMKHGRVVKMNKASMKKAQAMLDKAIGSLMNSPTRQGATKDRQQAPPKKLDEKIKRSREYRIKGAKLYLENQFDEAIAAYKKALELDPDDYELLRMMGMAYVKSGNRKLAHLYYSMYVGCCPRCKNARSVKRILKGLK